MVGLAHLEMKLHAQTEEKQKYKSKYDTLRNSRNKTQCIAANKLRKDVGICCDGYDSLQDICKYEDFLKVGICVISMTAGNKRVYNGSDKYENRLFLLHSGALDKGHFNTITKN